MNGETILYVILPYVAMTIFVVGLIWRRRTDSYGWNARSSQLLEGRVLRYASIIFHVGVLMAIGGHILGLLIPASWTDAVGVTDHMYHVVAVIGGISAGLAVIVGFVLLVYRRIRFPRVRVNTTRMDVAVFALLGVGIVTGMLATLINIPDTTPYRETVSPYFRQLFILDPDASLMTRGDVSLIFQIHVVSAWFIFALWPFSRLVHAFSVPLGYFKRSPIFYRPRTTGSLSNRRPDSRAGR
jgi:nitrate reductase gamma subunit